MSDACLNGHRTCPHSCRMYDCIDKTWTAGAAATTARASQRARCFAGTHDTVAQRENRWASTKRCLGETCTRHACACCASVSGTTPQCRGKKGSRPGRALVHMLWNRARERARSAASVATVPMGTCLWRLCVMAMHTRRLRTCMALPWWPNAQGVGSCWRGARSFFRLCLLTVPQSTFPQHCPVGCSNTLDDCLAAIL